MEVFNPYTQLGLDNSASKEEIKKAYYNLSKTHHPDHGGDEDEFKNIARAYEILTDPQKKAHYDETGFILGEQNLDQMMTQVLFKVMTEAVMMFDPDHEDILKRTKEGMTALVKDASGKLTKLQAYQRRLVKTEKKLTAKGSTILLKMLGSEIAGVNHKVERGKLEMKALKKATRLLEDYDFEHIQRVASRDLGDAFSYTMRTGTGW